jgi:hypothetical protein
MLLHYWQRGFIDMNARIPKEKLKWWTHKGESADIGHSGGRARSSDEVSVMET